MANSIYDTVEVKLEDGTPVTLKPLTIKYLRKFMHEWEQGFVDIKNDDGTTRILSENEVMDIYIRCSGIALSRSLRDKVDVQYIGEYELHEDYQAYLEDNLDIPTIHKVLEVCGGIQLDDPKLMEAAMAIVAEQDGLN